MSKNQESMTLQMRVRVAKMKRLARELPNTYLGDDFIRRQRIKLSDVSIVPSNYKGGSNG